MACSCWMNNLPKRNYKKAAPRSDARARVLAAWRGVDVTPLEKAHKVSSKNSNELVTSVMKSIGLDRRQSDAEVLRVWNNLIDPNITAHAQPTGLHKGTLFVTVDSSVWLDEIVRYRRKEILTRLQHSFGKDLVARISFRVG